MSTENKQKFVNVSYIDAILRKLYDWMPLKKKNGGLVQDVRDENDELTNQVTNQNEIALGSYNVSNKDTILSVGIGVSDDIRKNAIEIKKDGMIYIITDINTNSVESLQNIINKSKTTLVDNYSDLLNYSNIENLGRLFLLTKDSSYEGTTYVSGLYMISMVNEKPGLIRFGETSSTSKDYGEVISELEIRIGALEELEDRVIDIEQRVEELEDWKDSPLSTLDLETITNIDLNNDNKIG